MKMEHIVSRGAEWRSSSEVLVEPDAMVAAGRPFWCSSQAGRARRGRDGERDEEMSLDDIRPDLAEVTRTARLRTR